ncbi:MAG TPA: chromosomal replication initiator protein DnaA [Candidatus Saccharimonadales bacterium]|nr:chromosomal replication initiator protein DnaA [Candidatus Saccharimonadales bacterium]HSW91220.1 chromosomal replication initiator protein DnaA [Candidatus Saccharimonadales bacterium]
MYNALWQSVLGEIELSVPHGQFEAWFKNTTLLDYTDDAVTIGVANIFAKSQFEKRYDDKIREVLKHNGVAAPTVQYQVHTVKKSIVNRETTGDTDAMSARIESLVAPMPSVSVPASSSNQTISANTLNPRYSLDNFIVGSSNDLAYAACQAVAVNPGTKYNPLFLYGGVGLGKTHLMQAVGNAITRQDPSAKVLYINTETFVKEYVEMIRFKKKSISDKYRSVDVLIVDDMQFIAGKEKVQEEFFHTFNALHQANKQIIISSDKPPRSIPTLTERLRSRFEWGMAIDIQMPDFETRCAIVETKAGLSGVNLEHDTVEYLAKNIKTNVRELEGALNQLLAYAEMRGVAPDVTTAEGLLGNVRQSRPQHVTSKQIIDKTARHFQIDAKEICSSRRDKYIVVPRQIAMYLLRSELHMSFPRIAQELGRKDHTTAIHSVEKIEKSIKLDFMIREQVAEIREKLYA